MSVEIKNQDVFGKVIANALVKIDANIQLSTYEKLRWSNAVVKAVVQIEDHGTFMDWDEEKQTLLIWSDKSNKIYEANGVCQCKAFELGQPCWHKAAKQLIKNYFLELAKPENVPALDTPPTASSLASRDKDVPYLKMPTGRKPESFGNYRI